MKVQLVEAEDGEQILILPPGYEFAADEVQLIKDGDRVIICPAQLAEDLEV